MKLALALWLAAVAVASARILPDQIDLEDLTAYNYLAKIGLPLAEDIRKYEESNARIVGGSPAAPGAIPYQAGLLLQFSRGQGVCGASLVSRSRLVTAAHCWFDGVNQASSVLVVLGSVTLFAGGTRIATDEVVMHSGWNPAWIRNDIAVIKLPAPVTLGGGIATIALPAGSQLNEYFAGDVALASGFGRTSDAAKVCLFGGGAISSGQFLSQVRLAVITNIACERSFPVIVQDSNICTSGADGRSTCNGDSGGPLVVAREGRPILIGVVSFGSARGCEMGYPAAYARTTSFIGFIRENL